MMIDRAGIAERLRGLLLGHGSELSASAERLGVDETALQLNLDELSPHPTVEVLAAVIRVYGIDPSWLLTGVYDAATHRSVMDGDADAAAAVRRFFDRRPGPVAEPTREPFPFNDQD
jgi:transcriptional regulator with XRE-family HTH domain